MVRAAAVPLLESAAAGSHTEICRLLLDAGADAHARREGGFPARTAEQNGNDGRAQLLRGA